MDTTTEKTDFELTVVRSENPKKISEKQIATFKKFIECVGLILEEKVVKAAYKIDNKYDFHDNEYYNVFHFWITSEAKNFFLNNENEYFDIKILEVNTAENSNILITKRIISINENHLQVVISENQ
jgi:hypothetical protein